MALNSNFFLIFFLFVAGCNKDGGLRSIFGNDVSKFHLEQMSKAVDADVYRFQEGKKDAMSFSDEFRLSKYEGKKYSYAGMSLNAPYYLKDNNDGSYLVVVGERQEDNSWILLIIDY